MIVAKTYAAMSKGAALEPFALELAEPRGHSCIVEVLACGVCHSDLHMIDDDWRQSRYPLVGGHEIVGQVVAAGELATHLRVGDRVGIGWQQHACLVCTDCLAGNENLCRESEGLIVKGYGGFASHVAVDGRFAFHLPESISVTAAGPLMCGGTTVYSALRRAGMTSGQEIGVIGLGGLGHMAVQFAHRLGNRVTVYTTSDDKAAEATRLGASESWLVKPGKPPPRPSRKLDILISTVPHDQDWHAYLGYLGSDGTLTFVAVPKSPITLSVGMLLGSRRRVMGSPIGGRGLIREMLRVAADHQVRPVVEVFPMQEINSALERVRRNEVRYRAVLTNTATVL